MPEKCVQTEPDNSTTAFYLQTTPQTHPPEWQHRQSVTLPIHELPAPALATSGWTPGSTGTTLEPLHSRSSPHLLFPPNPYTWPAYTVFQHSEPTPPGQLPTAKPTQDRSSQLPTVSGMQKKKKWRSIKDKTEELLALPIDFNWTIGHLFYFVCGMRDIHGKPFEPSQRHYQMVAKFFGGETDIPVGKILDIWLKSPYGLPPENSNEREMLYSTKVDFLHLKYARPAITSFAAQLIKSKLMKEAQRTVKKDRSLHTFTSKGKEISRYDLGAQVFSEAMEIFQEGMPLAWQYLLVLATPNEQVDERQFRPLNIVSAYLGILLQL